MSLSHESSSSSSSSSSSTPWWLPEKLKSEKQQQQSHNPRLLLLRLKSNYYSKLTLYSLLAISALFLAFFFFLSPHSSTSSNNPNSPYSFRRSLLLPTYSWGGSDWEKKVRSSARIRRPDGLSVLVTGAAGFVGTHVSASLKRRGDGVLGLDSFNHYYDPSLKRSRQSLLARTGVFVVEGDINDSPLLRKLFDVVPFTHVAHLAAQAGVRYAIKNPSSYVHSNVAGLVSLLEAAAKSADPQPAVVWASSSSVYGLNPDLPFSESHRTDRPASLYAATKKAGEEIAHAYSHIYGLSITALRFFTVYGPWGRPDMAYYSFTKDILKGKPITIFQGPDHSSAAVARDFTYIDDVVRGFLAALDTAQKSTGTRGGRKKQGGAPAQLRVYNLGNTSPVPVTELVSILERLLKVKANRKFVRMPANGDVQFTHANISLAQSELGYHPTTDLKTGLKKFVKWYLDYYNPITHKNSRSSSRS